MKTQSLKTSAKQWAVSLALGGAVLLAGHTAMARGHDNEQAHGAGWSGMEHRPMHHSMKPQDMQKFAERRIERLSKQINATPEQKTKLLALEKAQQEQMVQMHTKQQELQKQQMELMTAPKLDRGALEKVQSEIDAYHEAGRKLRQKTMLDQAEILTPEQRVKMASRMHKRMGQGAKG